MNIIIIDDHPLVRKGLDFVLSLEDDIEVIGEASNIKEGLDLINYLHPDIALIDLKLGNEYGLDIIDKCNNLGLHCKFVVLTSSAYESDLKKAEELGALGYILKEALPEELLYAIRLVNKGRKYYDPGIIEEMMKGNSNDILIDELTPREYDVLITLGQGLCNKDIAKKLFITEYTVKKHVSQILAKLDLTDRTQAALYAQSKGLIKVS